MGQLLQLLIAILAIIILSPAYFYVQAGNDQALVNDKQKVPQGYRTITHLHTSFSHDAKFASEPNIQLKNLKDQGYQAVLVTEHDHSTHSSAQTDFFIPNFKNGGFEMGELYPKQWVSFHVPRASAEYLNVTDSNLSFEGQKSFHLSLKGNEDDFDLLSFAYKEKGEDRVRERPMGYDLWLRFSLYYPEELDYSDSIAYICSVFGRRDDPAFPQLTNRLCFYFSEEALKDTGFFDLTNSTSQISVRLEAPSPGKWESYSINLSDYAFQLFDGLDDIPTKYLLLRQVTLNIASKNGAMAEMYVDDFQVFSGLTTEEMYKWWRNDIESYSDDNFLVIAGLETTHKPADIAAYGLEEWHDFSTYDVESRIETIEGLGAISSITSPRAHNFTNVKEGGGWGAEFFEIFNTVHDSHPSIQVLKGWDHFLTQGATIFGLTGFDSHGLKGTPGKRNPTVVQEPLYENIVLAESLSRDDIFSAFHQGHLYVVRSDHAIRMAFSPGQEILKQVGGVVYTAPNEEAVMNVYMEGVSPGSELFVIQNGARAEKVDIDEDPFYTEIQLPLTGADSYVRLEVHHLGERVAFSNPIFFRQAMLPEGVWIALDLLPSSSRMTSVQATDGEVKIQLESMGSSSSVLRIHSPLQPLGINVDGNDYSTYEMPIQDLEGINEGWNYLPESQMLTLKLTNDETTIVTLQYVDNESPNTRELGDLSNPLLLGIVAVAVGLGATFGIIRLRKSSLKVPGSAS